MPGRHGYEPTAYDDDWEGQPAQSAFHQWGLGAVVAAAVLAYGVWVIATGRAVVGRNGAAIPLYGLNAVAYGVAAASLGLVLHCHYFWGNVYDQAWPAVLGKIVGLCGAVGGLCVLIFRVGFLGVT